MCKSGSEIEEMHNAFGMLWLSNNTSALTPGVNHEGLGLDMENKEGRPHVVFSSLLLEGSFVCPPSFQTSKEGKLGNFFTCRNDLLRDFPCAAHYSAWAACEMNAKGSLVLLINEENCFIEQS